jgi:SpoIID/LytB domain protein
LRAKLPEARDLVHLTNLRVVARGVSGRASRVELEWVESSGARAGTTLASEYRIREVLHRKFLYSSAFALRIERDTGGEGYAPIETVTLRGAGWGHGVGMCQIGALGMALLGNECESICRHYYPESRLATVYE